MYIVKFLQILHTGFWFTMCVMYCFRNFCSCCICISCFWSCELFFLNSGQHKLVDWLMLLYYLSHYHIIICLTAIAYYI